MYPLEGGRKIYKEIIGMGRNFCMQLTFYFNIQVNKIWPYENFKIEIAFLYSPNSKSSIII